MHGFGSCSSLKGGLDPWIWCHNTPIIRFQIVNIEVRSLIRRLWVHQKGDYPEWDRPHGESPQEKAEAAEIFCSPCRGSCHAVRWGATQRAPDRGLQTSPDPQPARKWAPRSNTGPTMNSTHSQMGPVGGPRRWRCHPGEVTAPPRSLIPVTGDCPEVTEKPLSDSCFLEIMR